MTEPRLTLVDRGTVASDANLVVDGAWRATRSDPTPEPLYGEGPVVSVVIETDERTLLWDTGMAPDAEQRWPDGLVELFDPVETRPLADDLDDAGYALADIDAVVTSHLHMDHAGGLGELPPEMPVYVHRDEFGHAFERTSDPRSCYVAADLDVDVDWRLVHGERHQLAPEVELLHLPGHTPGLLGVLVTGRDRPVLLVGDLAYVRANYEGRPMSTFLLWSRLHWEESRTWCHDIERRHDAQVVFGHDGRQLAALPSQL